MVVATTSDFGYTLRVRVRGLILLSVIFCGLATSVACESADVDPHDLRGAFDKDASARASSSASGRASASASARASANASASALASAAPRDVPDTQCVTPTGTPKDVVRIEGRPACRAAEVLEWRDGRGDPRYACIYSPDLSNKSALPVLLFFHGTGPSIDDPSSLTKLTSLRTQQMSFKFPGTKDDATGFIVLGIQGRKLGEAVNTFDSGHVDEKNLDVLATDEFLAKLEARGVVDRSRVYAMGFGGGATFALTYAALRPDRIAAVAAFAPPTAPASWECPTPPPPAWFTYRACDAIAPCEALESWVQKRGGDTALVRVGDDAKTEPACSTRNKCTPKRATANHHRFPKGQEKAMLAFLGGHTLRVR